MRRRLLAASALFVALAVVFTWPAAARVGQAVPADLGDPLLNTWILWWNAHAVPLTRAWWNAPAFYPSAGVLAYSEHLLGFAWLTTPLLWAGLSPLSVYTVAFIASGAASGLGAWYLARVLTGRDDAAVLAGVAFACAPYRVAQISHVQVLMACWMPLALAALHRYVETRRLTWLAAFAGAWILQGLTNGYFLLFFGVLVALWIAYFACRPGRLALAAAICAASIVVLAVMLPFLLEYRRVHEFSGFTRTPDEIVQYSADVLSLADVSPRLWLWGRLGAYHRPEGELFPGLTLVGLLLAGAIRGSGATTAPRWRRPARVALGIIAAASAVLLVSFALYGRWRIGVLGVRLTMVSPGRTLAVGAAAGLALVATWPGLAAAWRRRSPFLFYGAAAIVLFACALGPYPAAAGVPLGFTSPYAMLLQVPGFSGLRVPARFWMPALVCLSAGLALAWCRLAPARRAAATRDSGASGGGPRDAVTRRRVAAAIVGVAIAAEGFAGGIPMGRVPSPWPSIVQRDRGTPVVQLPGLERDTGVISMYRAIALERPVVAGYSGHFPASWFVFNEALADGDASILEGLAALGPADVLLDRSADPQGRWARWLRAQPLREALRSEGRWTLFALAPQPGARRPSALGPIVQPASVTASNHADDIGKVLDHRLDTAWHSARQLAGDTITIDLGTVARVGAVRTWLGPVALGYPRGLLAERSLDGVSWTPIRQGGTAGLAWQAALDRPTEVPLTLALDACEARYLRLVQTGTSINHDWIVAELEVFSPAPGASCAAR